MYIWWTLEASPRAGGGREARAPLEAEGREELLYNKLVINY